MRLTSWFHISHCVRAGTVAVLPKHAGDFAAREIIRRHPLPVSAGTRNACR
jgi:hypothetical protein